MSCLAGRHLRRTLGLRVAAHKRLGTSWKKLVDRRTTNNSTRSLAQSNSAVLSSGMTALAVSMLLVFGLPPQPVHAQEAPVQVNIAAQSLGSALVQLANQYSLELGYSPDIVAGLSAPAISGNLTADQALQQLLAGTGIAFTRNGRNVSLLPPASSITTLPPIAVTAAAPEGELPPAYAGGQIARGGRLGLLGNTDVMDTPFNVTSYTSDFMANRQAVTLADVITKDSSVRFTGQTGGITDSFFIRGFPIGEGNIGEIAFDGVYGVAGNYHVFSAYAERAEVLKGPGALLYGMSPNSGVGGVVNIVPKRSLPEDLTRVTTDYASDSQGGGEVDISRRFGEAREWGIRVNGMHRQGDTPLDKQSARTDIGAVSLDYRGDRLRASLDTIFQDEKINAPTRPMLVATGIAVPQAPDGNRNVTQPWGWWKSKGQSALLRGEYDVSDKVTAFANVGASQTDISRFSDQTPTILNALGDTTNTPYNARFSVKRYTADAGLRARASTGPVSHLVTLQASVYRDRLAQANNTGSAILSNIYSPVDQPTPNIPTPGLPKISSSQLSGMALADTLGMFDDRLQLTLGVRQQRVESNNYNASTGGLASSYAKSALTPLAGVVVKPWENVSLYANYIEGLSKGDIAPSTASNAGQVFAPYKSRQEEVGAKFDLGNAIATISVFQIAKPSGQLNGTVYQANARQRNRGLELNLSGEPIKGLRVLSGVTLINAKLTETNSAATLGNQAVGVPKVMANLGVEVDVPWVPGLSLNSNVTYTGRQYIDQANTRSVPSWTTVDLGARYTTKVYGKATTFRLTMLNAFNRAYWGGVASYGTISQGIPRTLMLSASMDF